MLGRKTCCCYISLLFVLLLLLLLLFWMQNPLQIRLRAVLRGDTLRGDTLRGDALRGEALRGDLGETLRGEASAIALSIALFPWVKWLCLTSFGLPPFKQLLDNQMGEHELLVNWPKSFNDLEKGEFVCLFDLGSISLIFLGSWMWFPRSIWTSPLKTETHRPLHSIAIPCVSAELSSSQEYFESQNKIIQNSQNKIAPTYWTHLTDPYSLMSFFPTWCKPFVAMTCIDLSAIRSSGRLGAPALTQGRSHSMPETSSNGPNCNGQKKKNINRLVCGARLAILQRV